MGGDPDASDGVDGGDVSAVGAGVLERASERRVLDRIEDALSPDERVDTSDQGRAGGDIPVLDQVLAAAGWTATPELSGAFHVGDIFDGRHQWQAGSCFESESRTSTYTETEMISQFQAGVRTSGALKVMSGASAGGGIVKQIKFGTPSHIALPGMGLQLSEMCRWSLDGLVDKGQDLSDWYVIKEVLSAEITEQTCGRIDASGRFSALGTAEAEMALACSRSSLEPVAVAYRTIPIHELLDNVPPPPPEVADTTEDPDTVAELAPTETARRPSPQPAEPATLWFLDDDSLYRLTPEDTEPQKLLSSSVIDISWSGYGYGRSGTTIGGAAFSAEGGSLFTWGAQGLAWINLATMRAERLGPSSAAVDAAVPLGDGAVVFRRAASPAGYGTSGSPGGLWGWSSNQGKGVRLDSDADPAHVAFATEHAGVAVLVHTQGLRLLTSADIERAALEGEPPDGQRLLWDEGWLAGALGVAVSPAGDEVVIGASTPGAELDYMVTGPIRFWRYDIASGRLSRAGVDRSPDKAFIFGGQWDPQHGPVFAVSSCTECDDPGGLFLYSDGQLAPYRPGDGWPDSPASTDLHVRMVQGQPELFVTEAGRSRQLTDLRSVRPERLGEYGDACEAKVGVAWRPWPDGRHVLVAPIHGYCEDDTGLLTSQVGAVLVDVSEGPGSQLELSASLGTSWPYAQNGEGWDPEPIDASANTQDLVDWSKLGVWSPDGSRLVSADGTVLTADGESWSLGRKPDWMAWQ